MQFARVWLAIDGVLWTATVGAAPMTVELFDDILVVVERPASQLRALAFDIHPPAVARIKEAFSVVWNILPTKRINGEIVICARRRRHNVDRWLSNAIGKRELLIPDLRA